MTPGQKTLADRKRGSLATRSITTVKKAVNALDTLDAGIIGGIDSDFYLGPWNPDIAHLNGVKFAFIRAGEGLQIDSQFQNSWNKSKGVMPRGTYWYLTKQWSNDGQAFRFAKLFPNGYDGDLPLVVDMEEDVWSGKGKNRTHLDYSDARAFLAALKKYMPSWDGKWINYSNYSFMIDHGGLAPDILDTPLWYSNPPPYFYQNAKYAPRMGKLPQPEFIQTSFAGDGILYGGSSKGCDLDAYIGHSFDDVLRKG
jgi:hypothetical protein